MSRYGQRSESRNRYSVDGHFHVVAMIMFIFSISIDIRRSRSRERYDRPYPTGSREFGGDLILLIMPALFFVMKY